MAKKKTTGRRKYDVHANEWVNCRIGDRLELVKLRIHPESPAFWCAITYYDCKILYSGSLNDCRKFIEDRKVENNG